MTKKNEAQGDTPSVVQPADPRRRVLDLMQRMARATAFGGAALGLAAAESGCPIVCDPLPPPITCANPTHAELVNAMSLSGAWVNRDGGPLQVHLQVENSSRTTVNFSRTPTLTGVTLGEAVTAANALELYLVPTAGVTSATVGVSFDCSGTTDVMTLTLDLRGGVANANVPVSITSP